MNRTLKMIICVAVIVAVIIGVVMIAVKTDSKKADEGKLNIVCTSFSTYDFTRQIVGDKANITFLLGPGVDAHSYEPSAKDLATIKGADVFIYIGGEMEKWVDKIMETDTIDENNTTLICVTDCVETIEEMEVDGAEEEMEEEEEEGAFDEHIWTSPANAIKMVEYLAQEYATLDEDNSNYYLENAKNYAEQIKDVQAKIQEIVDSKTRDILIFGDKMPIQYFLNEYGLRASAAFSGCSTETEPSAKTITYLVNKVKEENVPVVLYIEMSTGKTATSIANETGAKTMQIQTLHNVSKEDFVNGETYVSLMNRNLDVLKEALQ